MVLATMTIFRTQLLLLSWSKQRAGSLSPLQTQVPSSLLCVTAPAKATARECSSKPPSCSFHVTEEFLYFIMCLQGVLHAWSTALPKECCKLLETWQNTNFPAGPCQQSATLWIFSQAASVG